MRIFFASILFALVAGCGNPNQTACLPAPAAPPPDCPAGTFADASTTDPICLDANSMNICRGEAMDCYVCSGSNFTDGCLVRAMVVHQCVHACSQC